MKIARGTLVMAMDGNKMLLMRNQGDARKPVLQTVIKEEADNPRSGLQGTDRPGRSFSSATPRRSALDETDWQDEAKRDFARNALRRLQRYHQEEGGDVIVLAAPAVLGDFRKQCPEQLKAVILAEIDKDVVNHPVDEIAAIIDAVEG